MEGANGATPEVALTSVDVPLEQCHLVLINGLFAPPTDRPTRILVESKDWATGLLREVAAHLLAHDPDTNETERSVFSHIVCSHLVR